MSNQAKQTDTKKEEAQSLPSESKRQLLSHVVVLNVLSCNAYAWWWYYKNWKELQAFAKKATEEELAKVPDRPQAKQTIEYCRKMNVVLHAIGTIPPFIQLIFTYRIFKQIADLYPLKEEEVAGGTQPPEFQLRGLDKICAVNPALTGIVFTLMILYFTTQMKIGPEALQPVIGSTFATISLVVAQDMLNSFWRCVETPDKEPRKHFNSGEWILLFFAIVLLAFNLLSLFIAMPKLPTPGALGGS
jgi:hypothetical protein